MVFVVCAQGQEAQAQEAQAPEARPQQQQQEGQRYSHMSRFIRSNDAQQQQSQQQQAGSRLPSADDAPDADATEGLKTLFAAIASSDQYASSEHADNAGNMEQR